MADDRPLPSSFDEHEDYQESAMQKMGRKLREEPLVPLGTGLTCLALFNAWRAMRRGDSAAVQRMFRARIGAQAFTVVAIVAGGAYYGADREKRKELIKLEAQKRAEERNQKWLRELEVRDEEDKKLQAAVKRKRDRREQRKAELGLKQEPDAAAPADKAADSSGTDSAGSGVLNAISNAGGWFGTGKASTDQSKPDDNVPKK
ncbi:mitochondrial hypoxia responsive domain-containing protein [Astrocystis sublimbata]|nr:mitochondrial hypoxia responsive domain-containing protein [Astrocystis sublimbata]